jgi:hypothetical protein
MDGSQANAQLLFRCGYNLLAITKDVARSNVDVSIYVHNSALHSVTHVAGWISLGANEHNWVKYSVFLGIVSNAIHAALVGI